MVASGPGFWDKAGFRTGFEIGLALDRFWTGLVLEQRLFWDRVGFWTGLVLRHKLVLEQVFGTELVFEQVLG